MTAKICKITAGILFFLDFIGAIVLGFAVGKLSSIGSFSSRYNEFSWSVFFVCLFSGFVFCLVLYALGEILEEVASVSGNLFVIHQSLKTGSVSSASKAESAKVWICKKCNTSNEAPAQSCRGCGAYR